MKIESLRKREIGKHMRHVCHIVRVANRQHRLGPDPAFVPPHSGRCAQTVIMAGNNTKK